MREIYEFQGMLFCNAAEVAAAIAESWITAGGANSPGDIASARYSDAQLANEAISAWGLAEEIEHDCGNDGNFYRVPWLETRGLTRGDIIRAVSAFREEWARDGDA